MTREKWLETVEKIRRQFGLEVERQESLGEDIPGERWVVEFQAGAAGKIKMEWVEKPKLKNVKTTYSNRIGSSTKVENIYDENEITNYLNIYKWNEGEGVWEKMGNEFIDL
jgi:hypothetical protein